MAKLKPSTLHVLPCNLDIDKWQVNGEYLEYILQEQAMRCCLETETELAKDCRELLEDWPNEVDEVTLTKEILLGGWLQAHYLR